jgi:hypothetical protein
MDSLGLFDLQGPIMRFLEDVPVMGYAITGINELEGDDVSSNQRIIIVLRLLTILQDEAKRAIAECTYSTLITASAVISFTLTRLISASIRSAFSTMLGLEARAAISFLINNLKIRN